jgi:hypothetical protein
MTLPNMVKKWPEMTRDEQLKALDAMEVAAQAAARAMAEEINRFMVEHGVPQRVEFEARIIPTGALQ